MPIRNAAGRAYTVVRFIALPSPKNTKTALGLGMGWWAMGSNKCGHLALLFGTIRVCVRDWHGGYIEFQLRSPASVYLCVADTQGLS